jgi:hypothetical protein
MSEKPLLFSAPMVLAYLAGRKSQTRQPVKYPEGRILRTTKNFPIDHPESLPGFALGLDADGEPIEEYIDAPPATPGDTIWGKETWRARILHDKHKPSEIPEDSLIHYEADGSTNSKHTKWMIPFGRVRPSIHMLRWMARLVTPCLSLHVERLQDISKADAIAEGIEPVPGLLKSKANSWKNYDPSSLSSLDNPIESYRSLWEYIHGPYSWDRNPWVWVIKFQKFSPDGEAVDKEQPRLSHT